MRYEYLIFLLLIGNVFFISNNSQNYVNYDNLSSPIRLNNIDTPETIHKSSINSNLNITYEKSLVHNQQISLNGSSKYEYSSPSKISSSINLDKAQLNSLDTIQSMYGDIVTQNSGDLIPSLVSNNLLLETPAPTTLATRKVTENKQILQNSTIKLKFQILDFAFSQDKFAASYITFRFDNFDLSIILAHSQKYESVASNSSSSILLYTRSNTFQVNLLNLCHEIGYSYPSVLTDIIWFTASENVFTFTGQYSEIVITSATNTINLNINGNLQTISLNQSIRIENIGNLTIQPQLNLYSSSLNIIYDNHGIGTSSGIIEYYNGDVYFNGELSINSDFLPNTITIKFPNTTEFFDVVTGYIIVNNTKANEITISNISQFPLSLSFRLKLLESIDSNITWSMPLQGTNLTINNSSSYQDLYLISTNQDLLQLKNSETSSYASIPTDWPQGNSFLISWDSKPRIINEISFTKMYPILLSSNSISALPGREIKYQSKFLNSSSNEQYLTKSLDVSIATDFTRSYTNGTMVIPPIFKPGDYIMNITLEDPNVIKVTHNIAIHIEPFTPQYKINIQRTDLHQFNMLLNIEEYQYWSIPSSVKIISDSKNETVPLESQLTSISFKDNNLGNQNESILISIVLENLTNSDYHLVIVPNYRSNENKSDLLILTLTSFILAPTLIISTKYIKTNYFNKSLSF